MMPPDVEGWAWHARISSTQVDGEDLFYCFCERSDGTSELQHAPLPSVQAERWMNEVAAREQTSIMVVFGTVARFTKDGIIWLLKPAPLPVPLVEPSLMINPWMSLSRKVSP